MSVETSERDLLLHRLAGQRRHVLDQVEGLSDAQLRQPVLPSGWSRLGLLRHLTLSDERYWFGDDDEPAASVVSASVDDNGRQFGFWNIATQCADARTSEWRGLVREHVLRILASIDAPDPFEGLELDDVAQWTYARLYAGDGMPPSSTTSVRRSTAVGRRSEATA